jgi:predicted transcriptional regulator
MTETLSIRLDSVIKRRLTELSRNSKRSKSALAAEAITAFVEHEEWQMQEVFAAMKEMENSRGVSHDRVSAWLKSWGSDRENTPP